METTLLTNRADKNLLAWQASHRHDTFNDRMRAFSLYMQETRRQSENTYAREVLSSYNREVIIQDSYSGHQRTMLMFASNNYLGLANHPWVNKMVKKAIDRYGTGIGGPPLLNGYSHLMRELEERLAYMKGKESALIFSSGFTANLGILGSLVKARDKVLYDELSHASFLDGIHIPGIVSTPFRHNDVAALEEELIKNGNQGTCFVGVEGIYSMEGDIAPLDKIARLCKKYQAISIVDDAHGTGIVGTHGGGTADLMNCEELIDVSMGTFSKTFAMTGGFVAASADLVEYMRYFARPYLFSAALTPATLAAVLAGLDVMSKEPWLKDQLHSNVRYAAKLLAPFNIVSKPAGGIISLQIPKGMNIRKAAFRFHELGIFINSIEAPAVPAGKERFRISFMAQHTRSDIERLAEAVETVWKIQD